MSVLFVAASPSAWLAVTSRYERLGSVFQVKDPTLPFCSPLLRVRVDLSLLPHLREWNSFRPRTSHPLEKASSTFGI